MANDQFDSYQPKGFTHYGTNTLFGGAIVASLVFHAFSVAYAGSRIEAADLDVNNLVIVDVKKAKEELKRELASKPKERPKPKPKEAEPVPDVVILADVVG